MKAHAAVAAVAIVAVLAVTAGAQPANEIVPFGAIVAGGEPDPSAAYGITYSRFLNPSQSIDVTIMLQPTTLPTEPGSALPEIDLDVEYYHVGGRYVSIRHKSKLRPYVSMSLGMSRFVAKPGDSETGFSVGFGGGTDVILSPRMSLRFDARLFSTIALSSGQVYCEPQVCTVFASGSTFNQFAGSAGVVFRF